MDGDDGVDEFRLDPLGRQIVQRRLKRVHAHAVLIQRHGDHVDAKFLELGECAAIVAFFDDDRVARLQQQPVHQIHRLKRARRQQDVISRRVDITVCLQLLRNKLAAWLVPLRPALQKVGRDVRAFFRHRPVHRGAQFIDRHRRVVDMSADEVVFGKAGPARGWGGHVGGQQGGIVKRHGRILLFQGKLEAARHVWQGMPRCRANRP